MLAQCRPLIEVLREIPDPRKRRGKRHPLTAILALTCAAMLCGYRGYVAIAEWGRNYGPELVRALGFTRDEPPCGATLHNVLRSLDRDQLEAKLGEWAQSVIMVAGACHEPADNADEALALAIDGKTLRGSRKQGAPGTHLLSALSHRLGLTVAQVAVDDKTNEITAILEVLHGLVLEGRVITMDAMHTQRETAKEIVDGGGDYVMIVKENQPRLFEEIQLVFQAPDELAETMDTAKTIDAGHGRIEERRLIVSTALAGYSDWPGLEQVFQIERTRIMKKTGKKEQEVVYGATSLGRKEAEAGRLLNLTRCHWHIENKSHWVRDVTFDEDRSQVRSGSIPEVMAALRNTAIGLMRWAGETNIAASCRRIAAQPWSALAMIGIPRDN